MPAMSRLAELRRIADLAGIGTRHVDALGVVHEPDAETLSRLIAALGLPAEPQRAADALAEAGRSAPFGLGPVHIVPQEAADPVLRLRLPSPQSQPLGAGSIEWHCRLEDGTQFSGHSAALPRDPGRPDEVDLPLPKALPLGYHRLDLALGVTTAQIGLIAAPAACHLPDALRPGRRSWGLTVQLYGVRSARDWGIGDFTELAYLGRGIGPLGAAALGVNPLHALFAAEPRHCSPYSPSSRSGSIISTST